MNKALLFSRGNSQATQSKQSNIKHEYIQISFTLTRCNIKAMFLMQQINP